MSYKVDVSKDALREINEIYDYILVNFKSEETAFGQAEMIFDMINSLDEMPSRFSLWPDNPLRDMNVRHITVGNYAILYTVDEEHEVVCIEHVCYAGRNIIDLADKIG
ncbi:MAG: type II toxin-antitoxin system RelE/ParE family toxin [Clostridia bacterium]|nr:type II toxin-antitoxin system RelE/ParE family toxin [Clostridia bacterium]